MAHSVKPFDADTQSQPASLAVQTKRELAPSWDPALDRHVHPFLLLGVCPLAPAHTNEAGSQTYSPFAHLVERPW